MTCGLARSPPRPSGWTKVLDPRESSAPFRAIPTSHGGGPHAERASDYSIVMLPKSIDTQKTSTESSERVA